MNETAPGACACGGGWRILHPRSSPTGAGEGFLRWVQPPGPWFFLSDGPSEIGPSDLPNPFPYFPFYGADFTVATAGWPEDAVGAYVRLLIHQWERGSLPADELGLATCCCMAHKRDKFAMLWQTWLSEKFVSNGNGTLYNPRLAAERRKVEAARDRRAEAGRLGGKMKAERARFGGRK